MDISPNWPTDEEARSDSAWKAVNGLWELVPSVLGDGQSRPWNKPTYKRITVRKFLEAVNLPGTPPRGQELTKLVEAILSDMEQIWIRTQGAEVNVCEVESILCEGGEIDLDATVELSICLRPAAPHSIYWRERHLV